MTGSTVEMWPSSTHSAKKIVGVIDSVYVFFALVIGEGLKSMLGGVM